MKIRYAIREDYWGVEKIMQQVQAMHVQWSPDIYQVTDVAMSIELFETLVAKQQLVVAENDHHLLGILSFVEKSTHDTNLVKRNVIYIHVMAIDEYYRGQGIGHQLFDFVKKIAEEKHYDGLELSVNVQNKNAKAMYEKYGFEEKSVNMKLKL